MKKSMILGIALFTAGSAVAQVDNVTVQDFIDANPGIQTNGQNYNLVDPSLGQVEGNYFNNELVKFNDTFSGVEYEMAKSIFGDGWFSFSYYVGDNGYIANTTNPDGFYLDSFGFDANWLDTYPIYVSNEHPVTLEDVKAMNADWKEELNGVKKIYGAITNDNKKYKFEEPYKYFFISPTQNFLRGFTVNWTEEAPVPTVKDPVVEMYVDPCPGAEVYVNNPSSADLTVEIYVNDELENTITSTDYSVNFQLPGKAGDVVRIKAFATKEGWNPSQVVEMQWTLVAPMCATPEIEGQRYVSSVYAGQKFNVICADPENATITYYYAINDWNNEENNFESEQFTATAPFEFTVPDNVIGGQTFTLYAKASADGYRESYNGYFYNIIGATVRSLNLQAPVFSLESGDVDKGTKVSMSIPDGYGQICYTVNGGDVIEVGSSWTQLTINEDSEIVAWTVDVEPFIESEKVTATYTIEKIGADMTEILPSDFTDNFRNQALETYNHTYANGVEYQFTGGFWDNLYGDEINLFLFDAVQGNIASLKNVNAPGNDGKIEKIKVNAPNEYENVVLYYSDEPFEIVNEMQNSDFVQDGLTRVVFGYNNEPFNTWYDLGEAGAKYVAVVTAGFSWNTLYVSRVVVKYSSSVGVEGLEAENAGADAYYTLDGVKVNSDKLAKGLYIRVADGKASKVLVK